MLKTKHGLLFHGLSGCIGLEILNVLTEERFVERNHISFWLAVGPALDTRGNGARLKLTHEAMRTAELGHSVKIKRVIANYRHLVHLTQPVHVLDPNHRRL